MIKKSFYSLIILFFFNTLCSAQTNSKYESPQGFVAHEWGTFTTLSRSNGQLLSGLELEEEHLPSFVADLCFCPTVRTNTPSSLKGYYATTGLGSATTVVNAIKNVTVKMETPVLYFYSSESLEKKHCCGC